MIPKSQKAVVLVLNPLDALGDNQVFEKEQAGFTAINLTNMNFDKDTADAIMNGEYNFIYLSPEIFLNSKSFDGVYFSTTFQNRLAMIVVDEAHMIYIWGLVESSTSKTITSVHGRIEDYAIFRPCYGKVGPHLLFCNDKPILLLSATCRPVAVDGIMKRLKLNESDIDILQGELTQPKIRIIRIEMAYSLASTLDLIKAFPSSKDVRNEDLVPTLIYSGSRNRTLTAMEVVDMARKTPGGAFVPHSTCIRRFHSCTGDQDKVDCVQDFSAGKFPLISCTMALGLGQNWKRVQMVVHMGRGDPANISQMIGRCGRDGQQGLALMFIEKNWRNGKNSVDQLGYVPLWEDDPAYIQEREQEIKQSMLKCRCFNCAAAQVPKLMNNLIFANKENFDDIINNNFQTAEVRDISVKYPAKQTSLRKKKILDNERPALEVFKAQLIADLHEDYNSRFEAGGPLCDEDIFGEEEANSIVSYMHHIHTPNDIRGIIGGQCYEGLLTWLFNQITKFKISLEGDTVCGRAAPKRLKLSLPSVQTPSTNGGPKTKSVASKSGPRPPTKKELAAEASCLRSVEKKCSWFQKKNARTRSLSS
ncbi:hypothetical protein PTTG_26553 [Puccinia triticina 1-1 BBBD Race 1]|uniref:DNA 3'-5' helicase n=1 Tax=Puccinia triticina (isolate 1-1 / race 1 (BBBD)) TaxID=630390 RepID=A0A180GSG9_PUCT1|nr:hypothetical protein PTTG_26553 [Puccinia triticina 1-1 BBBD Race 1]